MKNALSLMLSVLGVAVMTISCSASGDGTPMPRGDGSASDDGGGGAAGGKQDASTNGAAQVLRARDDIVLVAHPGGAVRVAVLANDADPRGTALHLLGTEVSSGSASVTVANGQIEVRPPRGYRGKIEITYRVAGAGGGEARALLVVHVDSFFDPLLQKLEEGMVGRRMIDAFDSDHAAPWQPRLVLWLKLRDRTVLLRRWGGFDESTSLMPIASASKWFAGALALHARDEKRLSLDDPFKKHIPWFVAPELDAGRPSRGDSSIRQAFSISSGLYSQHLYFAMKNLTHVQSVQKIRYDPPPGNGTTSGPVPMVYTPGEMIAYDTNAMQVAGLAVLESYRGEHASWPEMAKVELHQPCGMNSTNWDMFAPNPSVGGGAVTTASDYMRFLDMIRDGGRCGSQQILSSESIEDLFAYHLKPSGGMHPRATPVWSSPFPNCSSKPFGNGTSPDDCSHWPDGTPTGGTYYEDGNDNLRYALGSWILSERNGRVEAVSSPGAFGAAPFFDRGRDYRGIFFTHVQVGPRGGTPAHVISEFYGFRRIRQLVDTILSNSGADLVPAVDL